MLESSDANRLFELLKKLYANKKTIWHWIRLQHSDYFIPLEVISWLIGRMDFSKMPNTPFIKYSEYLNYYKEDIEWINIISEGNDKRLPLPYSMIVDFVLHPKTNIYVNEPIQEYRMPQKIKEVTEQNLKTFLDAKPSTFNGSIVRMSHLQKGNNDYFCTLEHATYFSEVRTNLTIDFPLDAERGKTLRVMDLADNNCLNTFEESILVNSLGVSAVVFFRKNHDKYIFAKVRRSSEGVFEDMYGSVSGVCQYVQGTHFNELVAYAESEIKREFFLETGQNSDTTVIKNIIPLAFTRELIRGGKPQFFFLIEIFEPQKEEFKKRFGASIEGPVEFYDGLTKNRLCFNLKLSAEFATNIVLASRYWQYEEKKPLGSIII